jgi:AraC-like DNA-binding protein
MFEVLESKNNLEMRWDCDSELRQCLQGNLHGAAMIMRLFQDIGGENYRPICVNLPSVPSPRILGQLAERLECDVRCPSRHYGGIVLSKEVANRPLTYSNRFAFSALERPLAALKQSIEGDLFTRVRAFIRSHMRSPSCGLDECASALGSSVRTLQKQLASMDTSFSTVLETEKQEVAKTALLRSSISLDELAYQLGYAEQTTFGRAFRRWTGMTPGEFRRTARIT